MAGGRARINLPGGAQSRGPLAHRLSGRHVVLSLRNGKGERFSLIDPPSLPEKPDKPNRPAIVLLGFILALAGGIGSGAAAESLDHSIRTPEQLVRLTQLSPLAVIPFMPNEQDLSRAVKRRRLLKGAGVGAFVTILVLLHVFVVPLDVLWFAALRRFGIE